MYKYPYGDSQQLNLDWILAKLKELEKSGGGTDLEEVSNALISLTYNTSTAYRRYDYAFLNNKLYRCLSDTSGVFDPSAWQEALIGDDLAVLTRWINAIDAEKISVDFSGATSGIFVNYPQGAVINNVNYQVLRHVVLEKGQTIYVTTFATPTVAPLSLEITESQLQPLFNGTNSIKTFVYTASKHCQITVCTNIANEYSCYISGAFIGLTDNINNLYLSVDDLNGAIDALETTVGGTVGIGTEAGLIRTTCFFNATANIPLGSTGVTLEAYARGVVISADGRTGSIVAVGYSGRIYTAFFTNSVIQRAQINQTESPAFSGIPTAPTAASDTNTTQIATTAFVQGHVSALNTAINDITSKIGNLLQGTSTPVTVSSGNVTEISSITLPTGNWVILGSFAFTPDFNQDANGYIMIGSSVVLTVRGTGTNGGTFAPLSAIITGANNTTVTLKAYQSSGSDKTAVSISFRAIRIS